LEIECSFLRHFKTSHIKAHIEVEIWISQGLSWDRKSWVVIVTNGKLAYPPGVLNEAEVKVFNERIVDTEWNGCCIDSVSSINSANLFQDFSHCLRVMPSILISIKSNNTGVLCWRNLD